MECAPGLKINSLVIIMPLICKTESLNALLKDFHILTDMNIAIFDEDFHKIMEYPRVNCQFCERKRQNSEFHARCDSSDREAFRVCKTTKKLYMHKCHAGLTDVIAPIIDNHYIIGYMMMGQVVTAEDQEAFLKSVRENYPEDYAEILRTAIIKPKEQLMAAAKILEGCTCYLWLSALVSVRQSRLPYRISEYVKKNLDKEIGVQSICAQLGVSRSTLYNISKSSFSLGITDYIKQQRIVRAQELLAGSELPIAQISARVGMNDYNYFTKVFKKMTGETPRDYRKNAQTASDKAV